MDDYLIVALACRINPDPQHITMTDQEEIYRGHDRKECEFKMLEYINAYPPEWWSEIDVQLWFPDTDGHYPFPKYSTGFKQYCSPCEDVGMRISLNMKIS